VSHTIWVSFSGVYLGLSSDGFLNYVTVTVTVIADEGTTCSGSCHVLSAQSCREPCQLCCESRRSAACNYDFSLPDVCSRLPLRRHALSAPAAMHSLARLMQQ
jgi:hypothetical protein